MGESGPSFHSGRGVGPGAPGNRREGRPATGGPPECRPVWPVPRGRDNRPAATASTSLPLQLGNDGLEPVGVGRPAAGGGPVDLALDGPDAVAGAGVALAEPAARLGLLQRPGVPLRVVP